MKRYPYRLYDCKNKEVLRGTIGMGEKIEEISPAVWVSVEISEGVWIRFGTSEWAEFGIESSPEPKE